MFGGKQPRGFTIIEVMIFLTVSGILFLSAMSLINGEQGKTQFSQSIHVLFSQLQSLTNNVQIGYYNTNNNFSCTVGSTATGAAPTISPGAGSSQGASLGCLFIGQFIQFSPGNANTKYSLYTVVGRQYQGANGSAPVISVNQARPTVLPGQAGSDQSSSTLTLPPGLQIGSISYTDPNQSGGSKQYTSLIGFISSFAAQQANSSLLQSGSESIDLYPLPVVINNPNNANYLNVSPTNSAQAINNFTVTTGTPNTINQAYLGDGGATYSVLDPQGGVSVCFKSTSTKQVGIVNIGVNGNPTGMQLTILGGSTCP